MMSEWRVESEPHALFDVAGLSGMMNGDHYRDTVPEVNTVRANTT